MSDSVCDVWSDFAIRIEVGLVQGEPGPTYQFHQLHRGLNPRVPQALMLTWLRKNRRYLTAIQQERIRIVEPNTGAGPTGLAGHDRTAPATRPRALAGAAPRA